MRTPPKTLFLAAYRHPNGTYFRSSPLTQASFHQPLLMHPSMFGMRRLTHQAGRYVFQTGNYAKGKTFLNDYLTGTPSFVIFNSLGRPVGTHAGAMDAAGLIRFLRKSRIGR